MKGKKTGKSGKGKEKTTSGKPSKEKGGKKDSASRLSKSFNLCTYKLSALGEYTWAILQYGTTEGYSTQTVCRQFTLFVLKKLTASGLKGRTRTQTREAVLCQDKQDKNFRHPDHETHSSRACP